MPIKNTINIEEKLIYSTCTGMLKQHDFDLYIKNIWASDKYYGFNELFDTVQADWSEFNFGYLFTIAETAAELTTIDPD